MPDLFLYPGEANPADVKLSDPTVLRGGGGATLFAHVDFAGGADAAFTAHLLLDTQIADVGIGVETVVAHALLDAQLSGVGAGVLAATAHELLDAQLAATGLAAEAVTAHALLDMQLAELGVGVMGAQAEMALGAHADFLGTSVFAAAVRAMILGASVAFHAASDFVVNALSVLAAKIGFGGQSDLEIGAPPPPAEIVGGGSSGPVFTTPVPKDTRRHIRVLRTSVAFRGDAIFGLHAHTIPGVAEIPLPTVATPPRFEPALIGRIEHDFEHEFEEWTEEEELVAFLLFEEMAA